LNRAIRFFNAEDAEDAEEKTTRKKKRKRDAAWYWVLGILG
jgi:hypothetical protein